MEWLLPVDPRTNRPRFNLKTLFDLCRAFSVATRIINRERIVGEDDPEEPREKERGTIREAMAKTTHAMDMLPGIDSVAFTRDSLAKWGPQPQETPNNDYMI